jgi:malonyl-CoA O-methyltransferase
MLRSVESDYKGKSSEPEKHLVGRSFSLAASTYDQAAGLQREVGERLLSHLRASSFTPEYVLDVGSGTGYCTNRLAAIYPIAEVVALDIAEGMLRVADIVGKVSRVCGDAEDLPLKAGSVDVLFSNLALQWCADLPKVLTGFAKVLRPGGAVLFSTFGTGTLKELREAWASVDGYSHVNGFLPVEYVNAQFRAAGFSEVDVSAATRVMSYDCVEKVLRQLKGLGAHNITQNRARHLTGKVAFSKMLRAYADAMPNGRIEASFEIIYAIGRLAEAQVGD